MLTENFKARIQGQAYGTIIKTSFRMPAPSVRVPAGNPLHFQLSFLLMCNLQEGPESCHSSGEPKLTFGLPA